MKKIGFYLPAEVAKKFKALVAMRGETMTTILLQLIEEEIRRGEKK